METIESLREELERQRKVNAALMRRVERNMDIQGDAFSLFQTATVLEKKVSERTAELERVLSELKRSNRELRLAKDAAEAAARAKDEFLASMSHELRTPLNAVLGLSELLQEEIYGPLNPKQHESLRIVETSGRHLLALINDILEIARIGSGTVKTERCDLDVAEVCEACVALIRPQAERKGLQVTCTMPSERLRVTSDARRLKQVLVNLLGNAVKFTDRGSVGLEVAWIGDTLALTVSDTGIGIGPADQERIFRPFVQVESSLSRKYEGTGLGLALVLQLTELLGGTVELTSEIDRGSRFTVRLPLTLAGAQAAEADAAADVRPHAAPARRGQLILLAEDNEANTVTVGDYLRAKGYRVEIAQNGRIAVEKVRSLKPDLVLMDVQMPEMDGLAATRAIRGELGQKTLPVVALTALAMGGDRERCIEAGANDYVTKPVSLKQLLVVIEGQLQPGVSDGSQRIDAA